MFSCHARKTKIETIDKKKKKFRCFFFFARSLALYHVELDIELTCFISELNIAIYTRGNQHKINTKPLNVDS